MASLKPQLARNYNDYIGKLRGDFTLTQKLDGVRCLYDGNTKTFWTRSGKPIEGMVDIASNLDNRALGTFWLDGELLMTPEPQNPVLDQRFDKLSGKVRTLGIKEGLYYHVFDVFSEGSQTLSYEGRRDLLDRILPYDLEFVKKLPILIRSSTYDGVDTWNVIAQEHGWEGLMLNINSEPYHAGKRSKGLYKIKRWMEDEFECVDVLPGNGKHYGRIGALVVSVPHTNHKTYEYVQVGTGFKDYERELALEHYIGKMITVKYFERTIDGSLRFPVFKAVRVD